MTAEEFSDQFEALIDSYRRFKDFDNKEELDSLDFNEYEKSVFLTEALMQLVLSLYSGKLAGESFEKSEEARNYLSGLVKQEELTPKSSTKGISLNSFFFESPEDMLFKVYEAVLVLDGTECFGGKQISVTPVAHDEYHKVKENPFRGANKRRALRLDIGNDIEIVSIFDISKYIVRYVSMPKPIILEDLPNGLTIDNIATKTECLLSPALHRTILEAAVKLAINSKVGAKQEV